MNKVQITPHRGPATSKGEQDTWHSAYCQAHAFTNRSHGQCYHPNPSGPTTISSQVSPKSGNACPRQNPKTTLRLPPTPQAPEVFAHMEHILSQWTRTTMPRIRQRIKSPQEPTNWGQKYFLHHSIWRYPSWQTKGKLLLHGCVWILTPKERSQSYTHHRRWRPHLLSRKYRHTHRFYRTGQAHD